MASNPAFGTRLRERLREMGYWLPERNEPDVYRFAADARLSPSAVYRWLKGEVPRAEMFLKLCRDVQRPPDYMLTGAGLAEPPAAGKKTKPPVKMAKPIGGGAAAATAPAERDIIQASLQVSEILADALSLIRRWLHRQARLLLLPWGIA